MRKRRVAYLGDGGGDNDRRKISAGKTLPLYLLYGDTVMLGRDFQSAFKRGGIPRITYRLILALFVLFLGVNLFAAATRKYGDAR